MNEDAGWIKLSRKITNEPYYLEERFSRAMCWIDLLLMAEWRSENSMVNRRGISCSVKRGQISVSLSSLSKRWKLAVNTVKKRLSEMQNDGRIQVSGTNVSTRITILNYERYQGCNTAPTPTCTTEQSTFTKDEVKPILSNTKDDETDILQTEVNAESKKAFLVSTGVNSTSASVRQTKSDKKDTIDYEFIVRLYHHYCPSYPKVIKLSDKRKTKVRIRFEEMGFQYETLQTVFEKAETSRFMRGDNPRGWKADFDWIFCNPDNWVKILEGRYDNKDQYNTHQQIIPNGNIISTSGQTMQPVVQATRNPSSERQRMSVVATLAKVAEQQQQGNLPPIAGFETDI